MIKLAGVVLPYCNFMHGELLITLINFLLLRCLIQLILN